MARPKIDTQKLKERLIDEAEKMLVETQGRRLVLSELAARVGISQSYTHRFFPTKADLVRVLAARWFARIEQQSHAVATGTAPAPERLEAWIMGLLGAKRDRFDANPMLFNAYLDLAADHGSLVQQHTEQLSQHLRLILAEMVPADALDPAVALVEDATVLFRIPHNISRFRPLATDARAQAVVRMLVQHLGKTQKDN